MKSQAILERACENADWEQVCLNGGPPCFYLEGDHLCLRAKHWAGHDSMHVFVSLADFYRAMKKKSIGAEMVAKRYAKMTADERSSAARNAAEKRWRPGVKRK